MERHVLEGHLEHHPECEACRRGSMRNRQHRRVKDKSKHSGTMSADLSGPHVVSHDGNRYLLVMTYTESVRADAEVWKDEKEDEEESTVLPEVVAESGPEDVLADKDGAGENFKDCLLYTSPSPRD